MTTPNDPPLDEIQWRSPQTIASMGGLHSNTILFYFAESPFFERTSNNAIIMSQAMNNMSMYHYIQTREAFEGRLRTMSGLEFMVGEEPAETGPGMGTGVWVIRKQTRRKQQYQEEDEITVHATFFVVGENIYMAPTLADILASRIVRFLSLLPFPFSLPLFSSVCLLNLYDALSSLNTSFFFCSKLATKRMLHREQALTFLSLSLDDHFIRHSQGPPRRR